MRKSRLLIFLLLSAAALAILSSWQFIWISVPNASAITAESGIGVYWDQAATNSCQSIYWGLLSPGSNKTVEVYLKNERYEQMLYWLTTDRWSPINASRYITLYSDYNESRASPGSITRVSLTLSVSPEISEISNFSFDIVIKGTFYMLGDVNHDGVVDRTDLTLIYVAFHSSPGTPYWNADADINEDGLIDTLDLSLAARNYGKTNQ